MEKLNYLIFIGVFVIFGLYNTVNAQTVSDYEGNVYNTITIGSQIWTSENIRSTKYSDGTDVNPTLFSPCNGDVSKVNTLGYLYTWAAIMNNSASEGAQGICPNGWHVPSISDYNVLITYLGGTNVAGKKMKSIDANYWDKITFNDNSSGFNAHGGGYKNNSMYFFYKAQAKFWTSTEDGNNAKEIQLESDGPYIFNSYGSSKTAIRSSCRCVKNATTGFNDLNNDIEFNIYPNPTSGIINFNIEGLESQSLDLIIYNSFGQTIVFNQIQNGKIDMNSYCDGLYFYCLKSRGKVIAKGKFIKQ